MSTSQVYAVASGKGGVGKTTTAVNLAAGFAEAGRFVVLLDADLGMANLANVLDVPEDVETIHELLTGRSSIEDCLVDAPGGFDVVVGSDDIGAFGEADPARLRDVVGVLRERYDVVLLDTGGGLSHGTAVPLGLADSVVLVTTPNAAAIDNTEKTVALTDRLEATIEGVVATRIGGSAADSSIDVSDRLSARLLGSIPEDSSVPRSAAEGAPVVVTEPDGPAGQAYREVAYALLDEPLPMDWSDRDRASGDLGGGMAEMGGAPSKETPPADPPTRSDSAEDPSADDDPLAEPAGDDSPADDAEEASVAGEGDASETAVSEEDAGPGLASAIESAENDPDAGSPLPGAPRDAGDEPATDDARAERGDPDPVEGATGDGEPAENESSETETTAEEDRSLLSRITGGLFG